MSKTPLRIGFYVDDGYCKPVPAVQRAVEMAKIVLSKSGHCLVPFTVPRIAEAMEIFTASRPLFSVSTNMSFYKHVLERASFLSDGCSVDEFHCLCNCRFAYGSRG